ncbi:MAG: hypothetical protein J2P27_07920 [Actinobacteria bacterium]|nr:hypothetical protein [Actinomycetota bacterium]
MISTADVEQLQQVLMTPAKDDRQAALERLRSWKSTPIDREAAHALLTAAALDFPAVPGTYSPVPSEELVRLLWDQPQAPDPRFVEQILPSLPKDAQLAAIRLLASNPNGAVPLADVLRAIAGGQLIVTPGFWPVLMPLQRFPHASGELAGPLTALLSRAEWTNDAGAVLLSFAKASALDEEQRSELAGWLADQLPRRLYGLADTLSAQGMEARWSEDGGYSPARAAAGLLLDLASHIRDDRLAAALQQAAEHLDPWLVTWGVLGLARLGHEPPGAAIEIAAADPECRLVVLDGLTELGMADLIDDRWRTQLSIAEADMVRWLTFPSELGRPPTQIEHIQAFTIDEDGKPADLFLFKFRTDPPHWSADDGWMVGVSGPFRQADSPTIQSGGMTFSRFESLDSRSPAEHLEALAGTIREWAQAHGRKLPG